MSARERIAKICVATFFLLGNSALAENSTKITYLSPAKDGLEIAVVRSVSNECAPTCPSWISVEGAIVSNSFEKLKSVLSKPENQKLPIILDSSGGDMEVALKMGRLIRKLGMTTAIGLTHFKDCSPFVQRPCTPNLGAEFAGTASEHNAFCHSACTLVLLGGVRRIVDPDSSIGLHQPTTVTEIKNYKNKWEQTNGTKKIVSRKLVSQKSVTTYGINPQLKSQLSQYFSEMGASQEILTQMNLGRPDSMNIISNDHALVAKLGLSTTQGERLDAVTGENICRNQPVPQNCEVK